MARVFGFISATASRTGTGSSPQAGNSSSKSLPQLVSDSNAMPVSNRMDSFIASIHTLNEIYWIVAVPLPPVTHAVIMAVAVISLGVKVNIMLCAFPVSVVRVTVTSG